MKHEWRKHEKAIYLPKPQPTQLKVPAFNYFTVEGAGNPNDEFFGDYLQTLCALSYAVKMSPKKGLAPSGYEEYTVYPLEGVWDISQEAKKKGIEHFDKSDLVFKLMIRQPDFVDANYAVETIERVKEDKPNVLLEKVRFENIEEGDCIQMLHLGPYDSEPESFARMEEFAEKNGWMRSSRKHREIYLSDARRVPPEKLKTTLRFKVKK